MGFRYSDDVARPDLVANEVFGLRLASSAGLDAARAEPLEIDGQPCLGSASTGPLSPADDLDIGLTIGLLDNERYAGSASDSAKRAVKSG